MRVTFRKLIERRLAAWEACDGARKHIPGCAGALGRGDLPHDLVHLIAEAVAGLTHGFWGCVADGAMFESMHGKRTRHSRAIVAAHRDALARSEKLVFEHHGAWKRGAPTPTAEAYTRLDALWRALGDGGFVTIAWPSLSILDVDFGASRTAAARLPGARPIATAAAAPPS
jgi:hypothetical protein